MEIANSTIRVAELRSHYLRGLPINRRQTVLYDLLPELEGGHTLTRNHKSALAIPRLEALEDSHTRRPLSEKTLEVTKNY